MARAGSWKLFKYSQNPGGPRPQLTGTVCPAPPVFSNRYMSFLFTCVLETRNHGKWKLRSLYRYCMYARFPHAKGPCNVARPRQRLGQNARLCSALRGRLGIASEHARILAAPADARRIESRAALRRRRHLLSCDGHAAQPLPHDWICAAPAKPAGTGALSAVAGAVGALTGC